MTIRELVGGYYDHYFTDVYVYDYNGGEKAEPIWKWDSNIDGDNWYCGKISIKIPDEIGKLNVHNWAFLGQESPKSNEPPCIYIEVVL